MPDVPKLNFPKPKEPKETIIICSRGKLTEHDKRELEKYMEFRRKRVAAAIKERGDDAHIS